MNARSAAVVGARNAVKFAAAGVDRVRKPQRGVTILIYHRVGAGTGGEMDLTPEAFDAQLRWLGEHRDVITLDAALGILAGDTGVTGTGGRGDTGTATTGGPGFTGREVVLTFDDGTGDWVDHVLPALERHRTPATFYVATSFITGSAGPDGSAGPAGSVPGAGSAHGSGAGSGAGAGPGLSWRALAELASCELTTIGSHTHGHMLLDRLEPVRVTEEFDRAAELLGEHTGSAPQHFAYPKAVLGSPDAEAEVRSRFRSAVIAGTRANPPGTDPHRLYRSPIQASDGQRWFEAKATGGMRTEDDLRRVANRLRYRGRES